MNMSLSSLGGAIRHRAEGAVGPSSVRRVAPELEDGSLGAEGPFTPYKYPPISLVILHNSMARGMHTRKRSGTSVRRAGAKRRRTFKRRPSARKSTSYGSTQGSARSFGFSKRRSSRKQYRNLLWNASVMPTHYRSNTAETVTVTTPAFVNLEATFIIPARRLFASGFWTTAGGAQTPDAGVIPVFTADNDFIVRGGLMGISLTNDVDSTGSNDPIRVTCILIRSGINFNTAGLPASVPLGWDPSLVGDFQTNIGRIVMMKKMVIQDNATMMVEYKMPLQKVDQTQYTAGFNEYHWLILASNTSNPNANSLITTRYFNLSFTGDAST